MPRPQLPSRHRARSRRTALAAALLLATLPTACGGDNPPGPGAPGAADVSGAATPAPAAAAAAAADEGVPTWPGGPLSADTELTTTASGLRYVELQPGSGDPPGSKFDTVEVHYTGWTTDGRQFDSSRDRNETTTFPLDRVIGGWTEGLQLMRPGARYAFVIPSELAYGPRGRADSGIPPNATLVFDVELIDVPVRREVPVFVRPDEADCINTASGLAYEVVEEGTGDTVATNDLVTLNFSLWLPDGELLVATALEGGPQQRPVKQMPMPGLSEGVQQMRAGGTTRFIVPAVLAYGSLGIPGVVPPDTELICEVELLAVERGPEPLPGPEFRMPGDDELTVTASGLKYRLLHEGDGERPGPTDTVTAHYAGWLTDGTLFDSSFEGGAPSVFPLAGVIPGWTEGLQLMRVGGEALFVIPPELAYGPGGRPPVIPPSATLVFLVRLEQVGG